MPEAVAFDDPVSIDLFTDEELEAYFADGEDGFDADLGFGDDDPVLGGPFDPFAEPLPGPADTALAGRDGQRAGELMAASVDAGRDAFHEAVAAAVARLLDDPDWRSATVLFDDDELKRVADAVAAARAAGDLLGRARVRRLAEAEPAAPVPEKFAEGFRAFDCPCGGVAYDGDPARNIHYKLSTLCTRCGGRNTQGQLKPAVERFAEPPPPDPFAVFAAEPPPPLPPSAAAEYFRKLVPTVGVKPERFAPLFDRHAFTMAVAADEAVLAKVKGILEDVVAAGGEPRDAKARIEDLLDNVGVSPRNPQYSDLVLRTNAMDAYVQGQQSEYTDPAVREQFPAWEYHAVVDERSRPHHAARDGMLFGPGVTFQEVRGMGPADVINCRCAWTPIGHRELDRRLKAGETIHEG